MYDELVKELRELSHEFYLDDNDEYTETKLKDAADAIEELSKPCWIPVTEPPKYSDYYLVCDNCGRVYTAPFGNTIDWWLERNVTHWTPLPKPPKEEA